MGLSGTFTVMIAQLLSSHINLIVPFVVLIHLGVRVRVCPASAASTAREGWHEYSAYYLVPVRDARNG